MRVGVAAGGWTMRWLCIRVRAACVSTCLALRVYPHLGERGFVSGRLIWEMSLCARDMRVVSRSNALRRRLQYWHHINTHLVHLSPLINTCSTLLLSGCATTKLIKSLLVCSRADLKRIKGDDRGMHSLLFSHLLRNWANERTRAGAASIFCTTFPMTANSAGGRKI